MVSRSLIILISTILSHNLLGCHCGFQNLEYEFDQSKKVFVGIVIGRTVKTHTTQLESGENYKYKYYEYKIKVSGVFKGQDEKVIKVATSHKKFATCGMNFKLFKKYVVYAQEDKRYGLFTTMCHRNIRKSNRKFDRHIFRDEVKGLKQLKDMT